MMAATMAIPARATASISKSARKYPAASCSAKSSETTISTGAMRRRANDRVRFDDAASAGAFTCELRLMHALERTVCAHEGVRFAHVAPVHLKRRGFDFRLPRIVRALDASACACEIDRPEFVIVGGERAHLFLFFARLAGVRIRIRVRL